MGKYKPLTEWLGKQAGQLVTLTFDAMEQIIGSKLPQSARKYRPWWGNETSARSRQCRAWLVAGWRIESADLINEKVVFVH